MSHAESGLVQSVHALLEELQRRFGWDFSGARGHAGLAAHALGAFTSAKDPA
jgi:hypothetical protein